MKNRNKKLKKKNGKKFLANSEDTPRIPGFKKKHKEKGLSKTAMQTLEINAIGRTSIERLSNLDVEVWCKWTILNVLRHDLQWLFARLNETIKFIFNPVNIKREGQNVIFFVQMSCKTIEEARQDLLGLLEPQSGKRIIVNIIQVPAIGAVDLSDEVTKEHIREALRRRFKQTAHNNSSINLWDLSSFHIDSYLLSVHIVADLGQKPVANFVSDTICENMNELHNLDLSHNKLKGISAFKPLFSRFSMLRCLNVSHNDIINIEKETLETLTQLQELNLEDTPFLSKWLREKSKVQLHAFITSFLPAVVALNNSPIDTNAIIELVRKENFQFPETQIAYFSNPDLQKGLLSFIQTFLSNTDNDRRALLESYCDNSIFTFHCSQHDQMGSLKKEEKALFRLPSKLTQVHNRNLIRCQDPTRRRDCIKVGGIQVVAFMQSFPSTRHILLEDKGTFQIDVPLCTDTFMNVHFQGLYWEIEDIGSSTSSDREAVLRQYSRSLFIVSPNKILHDDWFITTPESVVRQKFIYKSNSTRPAVVDHTLLVSKLCEVTGMNRPFSEKCLQDLEWDFDSALSTFKQLQSQGLLPPHAFEANC